MSYIATEKKTESTGALIYWGLSGELEYNELIGLLGDNKLGLTKPEPPSAKNAAIRAATKAAEKFGCEVQPVGNRVAWLIVSGADGAPENHSLNKHRVRIAVEATKGGEPTINVQPVNPEDEPIAAEVEANLNHFKATMTALDMSFWLLSVTQDLQAVRLRERGGFYFIPPEQVHRWDELNKLLSLISGHKLYQIPVMTAESAIDAICDGIRREADESFSEFDTYLAQGKPSTRGLNSWERELRRVGSKITKYSEILNIQLPELTLRAEKLLGALGAIRLSK